jgi:hypothetical protein
MLCYRRQPIKRVSERQDEEPHLHPGNGRNGHTVVPTVTVNDDENERGEENEEGAELDHRAVLGDAKTVVVEKRSFADVVERNLPTLPSVCGKCKTSAEVEGRREGGGDGPGSTLRKLDEE